jgi:hypothetical protein
MPKDISFPAVGMSGIGMTEHTIWFEIAVVSFLVAIGNILLGHFEEGVPRWRRILKFLIFLMVFCVISIYAGRAWFFAVMGLMLVFVAVIHVWWLPGKGINGWTGEPKDEYRKLRGWTD